MCDQVSDADLLELDDQTLGKRVPLRFVKRPYAQYDSSKVCLTFTYLFMLLS